MLDYIYLRYADVTNKQKKTLRQFCERGALKKKVKDFEVQFPKVHQTLTDGLRRSQRKNAVSSRAN